MLGIVTLLLVALAACEALEWPFLRSPLEHTLASALGRPVTLAAPRRAVAGSVRARRRDRRRRPGENDGHEDGGNGHGGNAGTRAAAARGGAPAHLLRASEASSVVPQATLWHLRGRKAGQPVYIESLDVAKIDPAPAPQRARPHQLGLRRPGVVAGGRGRKRSGCRARARSCRRNSSPSTAPPMAPAWPVFGAARAGRHPLRRRAARRRRAGPRQHR
ncbi:MAG: hypothetical protein U1F49_18715 [Rubrivivax sp.]